MLKQNWTYKKLGEVASFSRGLTFAKSDVADASSKKVLRSNNIDLVSHSLNFDDVACLKEDFIIPDEKKLHKGDVFICMSNGSTQHLGKVAFIEVDMDYAFGGFMGAIHPDVKLVYPKYAFYSCLSNEYRRFLASILNGININNLKWSELSKFTIPVPPIETQSRIVSELDLLQSIIDKQKAQLKELDNLAQAVFYDMFGDPVENDKGWEVKKLKDVGEGKLSYGSGASAIGYDGEVRYIRITDIEDNGSLKDEKVSPSEFNSKYLLNDGDILFARSGATVGKTYMHKTLYGKSIYAGYLIRLIPNKKLVLPEYVLGYTKTACYKSFVAMAQKAVAQPNINAEQYGNLLIGVPPLSLQQSFATKIESIEKQKAAIGKSIEETQKLFDYTMDKYFG